MTTRSEKLKLAEALVDLRGDPSNDLYPRGSSQQRERTSRHRALRRQVMIELVAANYSLPVLQAAIAFYESESGREFLEAEREIARQYVQRLHEVVADTLEGKGGEVSSVGGIKSFLR